ncbi:hypothetical protein GCM10009745_52420 [Kribbella yunnanensis]|uniref:Uncharacterized protein n=1 Tax=Kribbella yunnanensis TaxID=190194 RepID=A0ABP4U9A1_9ACTN
MNDLDFFAGLAITGTVLGVDATSDLATVQEVLGNEHFYVQPVAEGSTWEYANADYGLIDFGWGRERGSSEWTCLYAGTQNHRVEPVLLIDELRGAVTERGFTMDSSPQWPGADFSEHWVPGVSISALVADSDPEWGPPGTVIKMLGGVGDRHDILKARAVFHGEEKKFKAYSKDLRTLSDEQLARWLDKREPAADRELWWTFLRSHCRDQLGLALDLAAAERGVDSPDRAALNLAGWSSIESAPPLDDAVTQWLTTTPTLDEGRRLAAATTLTPDEIRLSRRLRDQAFELRGYPPSIRAAEVADELRAWVELGPQLLRRL